MSTATALQLVNRVHRKHRSGGDLVSFASEEGLLLLDVLNSAIADVLEERIWDFQIRTDQEIRVERTREVSSRSITQDSQSFTFTSFGSSTGGGDFVRWLQVTDDTTYANTPFIVGAALNIAGSATGELATAWPGDTQVSAAEFKSFIWGNLLPLGARKLLSVRHQEQPLSLRFVDKQLDYDPRYPGGGQIEFNNNPELAIVGGSVTPTENAQSISSARVPSERIVMRIYPIPDTEDLWLSYDYVAGQQPFSVLDTGSTLGSTPAYLEDLICDLAYAKSLQTGMGNEIGNGISLERKVMQAVLRHHNAHRPSPYTRHGVPSMDHLHRGQRRIWPPDTVTSIDT